MAALLGKEFLAWVAVANLLAWPAAYFVTGAWLKGFAFRPSYGWWLYPLAAAVPLAAALVTVSCQTLRAALADPVESLKYEWLTVPQRGAILGPSQVKGPQL